MRYINVAVFEPTLMACELLSHAIESCDETKVITTGASSESQQRFRAKKSGRGSDQFGS